MNNSIISSIFIDSEFSSINFSSMNVNDLNEEQNDCPLWIIYIFLVVLFSGSVVNIIAHITLWRYEKNGVYLILLQISSIDIVLLFIAVLELFTSFNQSWKFSNQMCMLYNGSNVFANTLILYLLLSFNFHVITYWNLHQYELKKCNKNPLTNIIDGSSNECLVSRSESRLVTIDYRKKISDISVIFPLILVWFISGSISLPNYLFSSTVEKQGIMLCVITENFYGRMVHAMLLVFSFGLPCLLLLLSIIVLMSKLCKTSENDIDNILHIKFFEIRRLIILSLIISTIYIFTSFQRHIFSAFVIIKNYFIIDNYYFNNFLNTYQIIIHYLGSSVRGICCFYVLPNLRRHARNMFLCKKNEQ